MANAYWLIEDVDQYEGVDDVKRRVEQAVRAKGKKQLLSVKVSEFLDFLKLINTFIRLVYACNKN